MAHFELSSVKLDVPDTLLTERIHAKLVSGQYERNEALAAQLMVDHGDRVLDLGSGIGYVATICAMLAGAENVVSVEANPTLLAVARRNLDANACTETQLLHGAVVGTPVDGGTVRLRQRRSYLASSIAAKAGRDTVEVPALVLSDLLAKQRPTVVAMDIEGAEEHLFETNWPDYIRVICVELHPKVYPDTVVKQIFDCMSASGLAYSADLSKGRTVGFCRLGFSADGEELAL